MASRVHLAGASVLALLAATAAQAQTPSTTVFGGGGTLAAKVYRDIFNCYSASTAGVYATSPGNPGNVTYPTTLAAGCTKSDKSTTSVGYEPVGSGAGLSAYTTAVPANFGSPATTNTIAYLNTSVGLNSTPYPEIEFAGSDAYLNSTQASQAAAADAAHGQFQLPTLATPIDLDVGQTNGVNLTTADVCNIFSGSTAVSTSGQTFSEVVVRSDGSGTSFIFSDFLALNCPANLGFTAANGFPSTTPNWTAVFAQQGNHLPIVAASGTGGVASVIATTKNAIGYTSPDYVYPIVPTSTAYPSTVNGISPVVTTSNAGTSTDQVFKHLSTLKYPTTYNAATIGQQINDELASPGGKGYPIVGYTFIDTYACYASSISPSLGTPTKGKELRTALESLYPDAKIIQNVTTILASQGFEAAPAKLEELLESTGAPFQKSAGIQASSCPKS